MPQYLRFRFPCNKGSYFSNMVVSCSLSNFSGFLVDRNSALDIMGKAIKRILKMYQKLNKYH